MLKGHVWIPGFSWRGGRSPRVANYLALEHYNELLTVKDPVGNTRASCSISAMNLCAISRTHGATKRWLLETHLNASYKRLVGSSSQPQFTAGSHSTAASWGQEEK